MVFKSTMRKGDFILETKMLGDYKIDYEKGTLFIDNLTLVDFILSDNRTMEPNKKIEFKKRFVDDFPYQNTIKFTLSNNNNSLTTIDDKSEKTIYTRQ